MGAQASPRGKLAEMKSTLDNPGEQKARIEKL